MSAAIRLDGVRKTFRAAGKPRSVYRALADWLGRAGAPAGMLPALDGLDFTVAPGERVGVVGNNGAGKTTLLRTIAGLYRPTAGQVSVTGEVALVTGLGIGMLDELSVEENIFLYGAINGMGREELASRLAEIMEWADLTAFRTAKLKTLSTGMRSRLAFSAVRHVDADVYLMDEVLSAGDRNFKAKCDAVFERFKHSGRTFVVASHELDFVRRFCDKALWLDKGRQRAYGEPEAVIAQYMAQRSG
jgi:ABC-type polysaccharide/polyol phosphate transport system ATPase subunit